MTDSDPTIYICIYNERDEDISDKLKELLGKLLFDCISDIRPGLTNDQRLLFFVKSKGEKPEGKI